MNMDIALKDIVDIVGGCVVGEESYRVVGICSVKSPQAHHLCYLHDKQLAKFIIDSPAAVIVKPEFEKDIIQGIVHENPGRAYRLLCHQLFDKKIKNAHHASAIVPASAQIGDSVSIGANTVIGEHVSIGSHVTLGSNVIIEDDAMIGEHTLIEPRVTICQGSVIGSHNVLRVGCVIGSNGFGYHFDAGAWEVIPQLGKVVTGSHVDIGANTTIDRGAIEDTVIGNGVIIDNLVQIGHNVNIGDNTAIAGQAGIAGSTNIGKYCLIGGAVAINGHINISDNVQINGHSSVYKSINEAGVYSSVMPAMPAREWLKLVSYFRRLGRVFNK